MRFATDDRHIGLASRIGFTFAHANCQMHTVELQHALESAGVQVQPQPAATARSNRFLRSSKALWNDKIYAITLWTVRTYGEAAARVYLAQYASELGY